MNRVAGLVLAAGQGRRMGGPIKLLAEIDGKSLLRHATEAAIASRARPVIVLTGHEAERIGRELAGLPVRLVKNEAYAAGLSTSLSRGIAALPEDAEGVVVLLGDMPFITAAIVDRLIAAFEASEPAPIVVPTSGGKRGNPVLWPRRFFAELQALEGDAGARELIALHAEEVLRVEIGEAVTIDLDTPEAVARAGGRFPAA